MEVAEYRHAPGIQGVRLQSSIQLAASFEEELNIVTDSMHNFASSMDHGTVEAMSQTDTNTSWSDSMSGVGPREDIQPTRVLHVFKAQPCATERDTYAFTCWPGHFADRARYHRMMATLHLLRNAANAGSSLHYTLDRRSCTSRKYLLSGREGSLKVI
jgi:hypothetical protein